MSEPTLYEDQETAITALHLELLAALRLIRQLTQTNQELCERAERAERKAAALDWLEEHHYSLHQPFYEERGKWVLVSKSTPAHFWYGATAVETIEAAMKGEPE